LLPHQRPYWAYSILILQHGFSTVRLPHGGGRGGSTKYIRACEPFPGVRHLKSGSLNVTATFPHIQSPELGKLILQYLTKNLPHSGRVRIRAPYIFHISDSPCCSSFLEPQRMDRLFLVARFVMMGRVGSREKWP
jgi:hypothetical protein